MYAEYTLNVGVKSRVEMYFSKVKKIIRNTLDIVITVENGDDDEFLKKKRVLCRPSDLLLLFD